MSLHFAPLWCRWRHRAALRRAALEQLCRRRQSHVHRASLRFATESKLMLLQIIQGTPLYVWALLAGLLWLGLSQARTRTIGSRRASLLPAVFIVLSLAGVIGAFGANAIAVATWAIGIVVSVAGGPRLLPRLGATWQAAGDSLQIAGSWLPLGLIVALFMVKYAAGISLAMHPQLAAETPFVVGCSFAYGVFSGLFAARGLQLWQVRRLARA
jgi:hypothetical protein